MTSNKILIFSVFCSLTLFSSNKILCIPKQFEKIILESSAFKNNQPIPKKYTGEGANYSPPLSWKRIPQNAKSLVIICNDQGTLEGTSEEKFVHWFIYNIPANFNRLPENINEGENVTQLPPAKQGANNFGKHGWSGPVAPHGTHYYKFQIYALKDITELKLPEETISQETFMDKYNDNIIGYGELTGLYTKTGEKETAVPTTPKAPGKKSKQPFVKKQKSVNDCGY